MVSAVDAFLALGALAGVALVAVGYRTHRTSERLGRRPFVAFTTTLGGGCAVVGLSALVPSPVSPNGLTQEWTQLLFTVWLLSTFPWFVFAVRYTGTQTRTRPRTLALAGAPLLVVVADVALTALDVESTLLAVLATVALLYAIFLAIGGTYLLAQSSYAYGHVPVGQGLCLGLVPVVTVVTWNLIGATNIGSVGSAAAYAGGAVFAVVGVGVALERYDTFDATPAIGTLGERGLTRETDDLMFVVDDSDSVVVVNETAVEMLGVTRAAVVGAPLRECLGHDSDGLRDSETVTVQTSEGARQYDPQVSPVRDDRGNEIGATLSLRDVTDRDLREQRLAVLNRVLRHNLRNEVDVLKGHAEALDREDADVAPILEAADAIASLGERARRVDQFVSESTTDATVDLDETVRSVIETVGATDAGVDVSLEVPPSATLATDRSAVVGALESALDNAVSYADSAVGVTVASRPNGYAIRVTDDGPGIPDWELDSLDAGTESPLRHSTGLGLWQLKWAVRTLNGDLSFDTTDGTTVEIFVPDRSDEPTTA